MHEKHAENVKTDSLCQKSGAYVIWVESGSLSGSIVEETEMDTLAATLSSSLDFIFTCLHTSTNGKVQENFITFIQ